jgi:predicted aldo/keto reductase-like oxidoreductase
MADDTTKRIVSRRTLLAGGAVAGTAAALGSCKYGSQLFLLRDAPTAERQLPQWAGARVVTYRPLGRTGFSMSDISFGCAGLNDPNVVKRAIERGINYFDTSPDYSNAASEHALGEGIRGTPRDKLFIVSKFCTPDGHLATDASADAVVAAVEASLRRLGTDYVDLVHIHAVNSLDRLMAPGIHDAVERLRRDGKVRFLGVSSHTPDLETVMRQAVDSGRFDVIMVAYNFANWPGLHEIFHDAHQRGVGVVAMKTLKGARHTALADFTPSERESFAQAAFKWVLSNPDVSGLVVSISHFQQIDEYLYASGRSPTAEDRALLEKYDRLVASDYCRPGCGSCLPACPHGVPVDDVLRYQMYAEFYGREKQAMRQYARVAPTRQAARCLDCPAPCQDACPHGLPVRDKLVRAHRQLSWG